MSSAPNTAVRKAFARTCCGHIDRRNQWLAEAACTDRLAAQFDHYVAQRRLVVASVSVDQLETMGGALEKGKTYRRYE